MEIVKCNCGKSRIEWECIGEDSFWGMTYNCTVKYNKYSGVVKCNACMAEFDEFDKVLCKVEKAPDIILNQ